MGVASMPPAPLDGLGLGLPPWPGPRSFAFVPGNDGGNLLSGHPVKMQTHFPRRLNRPHLRRR
jgi:hypothetical protein